MAQLAGIAAAEVNGAASARVSSCARQKGHMLIRRLLASSGLGPDEVENLCRAYDDALHALCLVDRNDPISEMVARKIIEIGARFAGS